MIGMKLCLVVDDHEVIRKVARSILEKLGYHVAEAGTVNEAIAAVDTEMPDLIFADWRLPDGNTHELISTIRKRQTDRFPTIVYLVTEKDADDIRLAFTAGADDFMFKPFDRDLMRMKLSELTGSAMELYAEAE